MTSHKRKQANIQKIDTWLSHGLKNWAGRKAAPSNGKQRLLLAAAGHDRQVELRQANVFMRFLPAWLLSYLFDSNWVFEAGELNQFTYANRTDEISYSLMIYLYGVRITAT